MKMITQHKINQRINALIELYDIALSDILITQKKKFT